MHKKLTAIILILFITLGLTGCSSDLKFIFKKEKLSYNFYTDQLINSYIKNPPLEVYVFDVNMYKQINLSQDQNFDILKFVNSLKPEYCNPDIKNSIEDKKSIYKVFISFADTKYAINIYDENYISISPWDGSLDKDYVDMKDIPLSLNLYGLCKYYVENNR